MMGVYVYRHADVAIASAKVPLQKSSKKLSTVLPTYLELVVYKVSAKLSVSIAIIL